MSDPKVIQYEEQKEKNPVQYESKLSDLTSFNAYGVVTLSDGQRVNTQITMRHGIPLEKAFEDFKKWVALLDTIARDHDVKFWDGNKKGEGTNGSEPAKDTETKYERVDSNGHPVENVFPAGVLTVEYKKGTPYFSVTDASSKKTKFPVRVWGEVLEKAGIAENDVDPREGMKLTGWDAIYETKEGTKWPAKVIELVPPPFAG